MKQNRFVTAKNARAVALALLLFVYPIIVLSFASIRYTETIHRISTSHTFDQSLFGSVAADSLAAVGFLALFTRLAFSSNAARIGSVAAFAAGIALYIASPGMLQVAGIATLPSLIALLVVTALANRGRPVGAESQPFHFGKDELYRVGSALLVIIIILEIGALAKWVTHPFFPSEIYSEGDPSWRFAELESALFHSLGLLSPYLVALIAFSFFYKWFMPGIMKRITGRLSSRGNDFHARTRSTSNSVDPDSKTGYKDEKKDQGQNPPPQQLANTFRVRSHSSSQQSKSETTTLADPARTNVTSTLLRRNAHWMILATALVIAPLLVMYPHLPGINSDSSGVSTDEKYYMEWMTKLRANTEMTWTETITNAFTINNGDRPLTLLLILAIANLTGLPDIMVIRFLPVALAPALVFANYILIRNSLGSDNKARLGLYASIGAMFAAFSPQIVVGEYAGFLANWIAIIGGYFALYFLIKAWESRNQKQAIQYFGVLFAVLFVMLLIHVYTWAHLLAVLLLFGGISFIFARKSVAIPKVKIIILLAIIGTSFVVDQVKSSYFSTPAAAESESSLARNILPQDSTERWDRLFFTLSSFVGGYLSNPVFLILTFIWTLKSTFLRSSDGILLALLFMMALPIAIGSVEFQTRVFYNTPVHIPALLALYGLASMNSHDRGNSLMHYLLIIAVIASAATYATHAMANLYLVLPPGFQIDNEFLLP